MNIYRDRVTLDDVRVMLEEFPGIVPRPVALRKRVAEGGPMLVPELLLWLRDESTSSVQAETRLPWYFNRLEPSGTIVAVEPSGDEHIVKHGRMDCAEGRALINAMIKALT